MADPTDSRNKKKKDKTDWQQDVISRLVFASLNEQRKTQKKSGRPAPVF